MNLFRHQDSVIEEPSWEAYQFLSDELSTSTSIVARGQFGSSYFLGRVRPNKPLHFKTSSTVMMKSCAENEQAKCYNGLKSEMNILYDLCHRNVIQLVGYCNVENYDVCRLVLVFENCKNGNLIKVLQKGREFYNSGNYCAKNVISHEALSPEKPLNFCDWQLLKWATEIARGMEYLAFKGVIHGDIAARNVVLTCDWTAKICNFGVAQRQRVQESYAQSLPKDVLPISWMAPEAIQTFKYSEKTDVWSYAVTLWEIYSLGEVPYKDAKIRKNSAFFEELLLGYRLCRPVLCSDNVWDLMKSCWAFQAEDRPTFSKIKTFLDRIFPEVKPEQSQAVFYNDDDFSRNSGYVRLSSRPKEESSISKAGTLDPSAHGKFIKKCIDMGNEVLSRARIKSTTT